MNKSQSTRERLIEFVQSAGYDVMTACEYADCAIREFVQSDQKQITLTIDVYHGQAKQITIAKLQ